MPRIHNSETFNSQFIFINIIEISHCKSHLQNQIVTVGNLEVAQWFLSNDEWEKKVETVQRAEIHSAPYNMAPEVTMDTSISWME